MMKHTWFLLRAINVMFVLLLLASCTAPPRSLTPTSPTGISTQSIPVSTFPPTPPTAVPTEPAPTETVAPEISTWLRDNAIPFDSTNPDRGFEHLMPLKELIGDARIVALGEATHGTHEFFQMKHRMLRFLVEEMGFNALAVELDWSEANRMNDYLQTGEGDPAELLQGRFPWAWNSQEILDMILWMRAHNENPGQAPLVSFFGFDVVFYDRARDYVLAYLEQVDPDHAAETTGPYRCFSPDRERIYAQSSAETRAACRANLQAVYDRLSQQQSDYEARSSPEAFAQALQSARIVLQAESQVDLGDRDYLVRARQMAENVTWILDQAGPGAKIVLWAHNYHVSTDASSPKTMGAYLRETYGEEMVVFGFAFYEGRFQAKLLSDTGEVLDPPTEFAVPLPPQDSYESYFRSTELPRFFLDLRELPSNSAAGDWLSTPHLFRAIGAVYRPSTPEDFIGPTILPDLFDVMIYFQDTSPLLLLDR